MTKKNNFEKRAGAYRVTATAMGRFLALCFDLSLCYFLNMFIKNEAIVVNFIKTSWNKIGPILLVKIFWLANYLDQKVGTTNDFFRKIIEAQNPDSFIVWYQFVVVFVSYQLISTFLLGVTLSQKMMGIDSYGNFIHKRIGGVLRSLLVFLLGHFYFSTFPPWPEEEPLKSYYPELR